MFCSRSGLRGEASISTAETEITSATKRKKLRLGLLGETQPDASSRVSHEIEHYLTLPVPLEFEEDPRSEEHTSELQSLTNIVCRLLLEKKETHQRGQS